MWQLVRLSEKSHDFIKFGHYTRPTRKCIFREHYNFFHVTSEVDTLILKKNSTNICFHGKMANHDGKGYILTTNLYKGTKYAALLVPNNRNLKGKATIRTEGTEVNKQ